MWARKKTSWEAIAVAAGIDLDTPALEPRCWLGGNYTITVGNLIGSGSLPGSHGEKRIEYAKTPRRMEISRVALDKLFWSLLIFLFFR